MLISFFHEKYVTNDLLAYRCNKKTLKYRLEGDMKDAIMYNKRVSNPFPKSL